jgi:phosphoribosylformylglycinamidine synthase subunit PurL
MSPRKSVPDLSPGTWELADHIGILEKEYQHVTSQLGRTPTFAELGVFSAMFSEHCSYKSSKKYLRRFPTKGKRVLQGPGENAGILSIGHGWGVAFKMESHNHPSYIEPYQGASTGVGGILRDVFTMGARPVASMNALCFGQVDAPRMKSIVRGVVKGVGDYGNCVGVPTVAGQTFFHPCYNGNVLVNAFTAGIIREDEIYLGYASGIGNAVVYVGSKTGRDGVNGATMASKEFSTDSEPDRPTVQVGDPFTEKLLLEATLEAMRLDLIVGIQDMGAAGLTSSSFEMAGRAGTGLEINLDTIPVREADMTAYELLLSESQERMLLVTTEDRLEKLHQVFDKWDLHAEVIGKVVSGDRVKMWRNGELVVDLPVSLVVDPPLDPKPALAPEWLPALWVSSEAELANTAMLQKWEALVSDIQFANPLPLVLQYDSTVGNRTEGGTFDDAAVLRLRELGPKCPRLSFSVDCNPRITYLHPLEGGKRAVAEAALNVALRGGEPIGITDCLNFGSPQNPHVMWQFEQSIEGISQACEALDVPVVSGNVSFYNDTDGKPIYPTPMVGLVGLGDNEASLPRSTFTKVEQSIALVGPVEAELGGSAVSAAVLKKDSGRPSDTDLNLIKRAIQFCLELNREPGTLALHDASDGGLATALLEMSFFRTEGLVGISLEVPPGASADKFLFGETIPRIVVSGSDEDLRRAERIAEKHGLTFTVFGKTVSGPSLEVRMDKTVFSANLEEWHQTWQSKWAPLFSNE